MVGDGDLPLFTLSSSATPFPRQVDTNTEVSEVRGPGRAEGAGLDRTQLITSVSRGWKAGQWRQGTRVLTRKGNTVTVKQRKGARARSNQADMGTLTEKNTC